MVVSDGSGSAGNVGVPACRGVGTSEMPRSHGQNSGAMERAARNTPCGHLGIQAGVDGGALGQVLWARLDHGVPGLVDSGNGCGSEQRPAFLAADRPANNLLKYYGW